MINIKYGFGKEVLYSFDDAIKKVTEMPIQSLKIKHSHVLAAS